MNLKTFFLSLCGFLSMICLFGTSALASEAMLRDFFSDVSTLQATFKQQVVDETGYTLERSGGTVYLSRPGQFRWDYFNTEAEGSYSTDAEGSYGAEAEGSYGAEAEGSADINESAVDGATESLSQQILADGQFIYLYDPELEQATRRSLDDALAQVPSLLLVQTGANVDEHFEIMDFGVTDGLSWVALKPKDIDAAYQQLMIGFKQGDLAAIELLDGLGNETRLVIDNVQTNIELEAQTFTFSPPDGVDLLTE